MAAGPGSSGRRLFAIDFDNTLVEGNSDEWAWKAPLPGRRILGEEDVQSLQQEHAVWTDFMDQIMVRLHREGLGQQQLQDHMRKLPLSQHATRALAVLGEAEEVDVLIISDANTEFIDCILRESGLRSVVRDVISNPACFTKDGLLSVSWYHTHSCSRCHTSPNLCKGSALQQYLSECGQSYGQIVYIGDGSNDLCPVLGLTEKDVVIARKDFALAKLVKTHAGLLQATVYEVDFAAELGDFIAGRKYTV